MVVPLLRAATGRPVLRDPIRAGSEQVQRGRCLLLGDLPQGPVDQGEQPLLVPHVADHQVDVACGTVGQCLPGIGGQR